MPEQEFPTFGVLLKQFREAAHLTQEELAQLAALSVHGISDLERGARRRPRLATVRMLADALRLRDGDRETLFSASRRDAGAADTPAALRLHNLPEQPSLLFGREREVADICVLLQRKDVRLVTLTGPGGVGKTRLGLQVATEMLGAFPDGVWSVRLGRLADPALVVPTIAAALDLKAMGATPIADVLLAHLREKRLLLLLDNFEQLTAAAIEIAGLLAACPGLTVLATSRVPLHVRSERVYVLYPLALPDTLDHLSVSDAAQFAAVALFAERAQLVKPDFRLTDNNALTVVAICSRLDGLPLAIELAASRIKTLTPADLLKRLERQLALLVGGPSDVDERQRTMRNTITWSYALLTPAEQRLFRRLAVFAGGCALEAIEAVCVAPQNADLLGVDALDGLSALVDHSLLLQQEREGEAWFSMLRVIREFALEHLEASGENDALRWAHARYYLRLAEDAPRFYGVSVAQLAMIPRLTREHDNLRTILTWSQQHADLSIGLPLVVRLGMFWQHCGYAAEGRQWTEAFLALVPTASDERERVLADPALASAYAWALVTACDFAYAQSDIARASELAPVSYEMAQRVGDVRIQITALMHLAMKMDDPRLSQRYLEQSVALARDAGDQVALPYALNILAESRNLAGEGSSGRALAEESLEVAQRLGLPYSEARARLVIANACIEQDDVEAARLHATKALELCRADGFAAYAAWSLEAHAWLVTVKSANAHYASAARLLGSARALRDRIGLRNEIGGLQRAEEVARVAREALGVETWDKEYAAGQALSLDEAIAEALSERASHPRRGNASSATAAHIALVDRRSQTRYTI